MTADRIAETRRLLTEVVEKATAVQRGLADGEEWVDCKWWEARSWTPAAFIALASPDRVKRLAERDIAVLDAHTAEEGVMVGCPEDATDEHYATCFGEHEIVACYSCSPNTEDGMAGREPYPCPVVESVCTSWLGAP